MCARLCKKTAGSEGRAGRARGSNQPLCTGLLHILDQITFMYCIGSVKTWQCSIGLHRGAGWEKEGRSWWFQRKNTSPIQLRRKIPGFMAKEVFLKYRFDS